VQRPSPRRRAGRFQRRAARGLRRRSRLRSHDDTPTRTAETSPRWSGRPPAFSTRLSTEPNASTARDEIFAGGGVGRDSECPFADLRGEGSSDGPRAGRRALRCIPPARAGARWPPRCRSRAPTRPRSCRPGSGLSLQCFELFEADDVAAKALGGWGAEVAYELGWRLGRAEHPEVLVPVEHAVELFANKLVAEAS
jgi:hypothetical protein